MNPMQRGGRYQKQAESELVRFAICFMNVSSSGGLASAKRYIWQP
jgi:hypothetical protein